MAASNYRIAGKNWANRGCYGSIQPRRKATYVNASQLVRWQSGNLKPGCREEAAKNLLNMGGADAILQESQKQGFDGNYDLGLLRW